MTKEGHDMVLRNQPYHSKSDAEVRFIVKDAGEAARAMRGQDPKVEGKYLDRLAIFLAWHVHSPPYDHGWQQTWRYSLLICTLNMAFTCASRESRKAATTWRTNLTAHFCRFTQRGLHRRCASGTPLR
jgi:hypothetical protein